MRRETNTISMEYYNQRTCLDAMYTAGKVSKSVGLGIPSDLFIFRRICFRRVSYRGDCFLSDEMTQTRQKFHRICFTISQIIKSVLNYLSDVAIFNPT